MVLFVKFVCLYFCELSWAWVCRLCNVLNVLFEDDQGEKRRKDATDDMYIAVEGPRTVKILYLVQPGLR